MEDSKIFDWLSAKVLRESDLRGWIDCWKSGSNRGKRVRYDGTDAPGSVLPVGRAGVRIGRRIDLGARPAAWLEKWGCPTAVLDQIRHVAGWTGAGAIAALHSRPIALEPEDAEALTRAVWKGRLYTECATGWDQRMPVKQRWDALSWEKQAAAAGLYLLAGWAPLEVRPALRTALQEGRWGTAGNILRGGEMAWGADWIPAYEIGHMMDLASR